MKSSIKCGVLTKVEYLTKRCLVSVAIIAKICLHNIHNLSPCCIISNIACNDPVSIQQMGLQLFKYSITLAHPINGMHAIFNYKASPEAILFTRNSFRLYSFRIDFRQEMGFCQHVNRLSCKYSFPTLSTKFCKMQVT